MEVMLERRCGLNVHQETVVSCTLVSSLSTTRPKKTLKTFGTRTFELKELSGWLKEQEISTVLMESTGQYWRPIWNVLEADNFKPILDNPNESKGLQDVKQIKKTQNGLPNLDEWD